MVSQSRSRSKKVVQRTLGRVVDVPEKFHQLASIGLSMFSAGSSRRGGRTIVVPLRWRSTIVVVALR